MAFLGLIPDIDKDVTLRMTPEEAKKEAVGKALGLVGAVIGATGTIMALSVNPAFKSQTSGAFNLLPATARDNKIPTLIIMSALGAGIAYWFVKRGVEKQTSTRYQ